MKVKLYSTFRELAGISSIYLDLNTNKQVRVSEIIEHLLESYPELKRAWLNDNGELHAHVNISLNKTDVISLPEGMSTIVKQTDELDIFPPISGGSC